MRLSSIGVVVGLLLSCACSSEAPTLTTCEAADGLTPICGFRNPEDLVALPGGAWLVVSQFAREDQLPGGLVAYRISDDERRALFPRPTAAVGTDGVDPDPDWASRSCPGPPDPTLFAPHGIDLWTPSQGPIELAVVNHGGRQAIEFFEVRIERDGPAITWRGCAELPSGLWGNDVAFLPDGGVVVTHMMERGGARELWSGIRLILGRDTGAVYEFRRESGWRQIPDSAGSGPNGVAVSSDGTEIFFGEWGASRLVRVRRSGDPRRSSVGLPHHPDNLSWARDGRLLVTGQVARIGDLLACGNVREGVCAIPFSVVATEPLTLETKVLLSHPATATGAASAAIEVAGQLYIGSFAADRIARTRLPPL